LTKQKEELKENVRYAPANKTLQWIIIPTLITALVCASSGLFALLYLYGISWLPALIMAFITSFILTLYPAKFFFNNIAVLFSSKIKQVHYRIPLNTPVYANTPLEVTNPEAFSSLTIQLPVSKSPFKVIKKTLDYALKEVEAYNRLSPHKANIIVCDGRLMVSADNDLEGFVRRAISTPETEQTNEQRDILSRLEYYRSKGITFVARPKPIKGRPETYWAGTFKKAGSLNYALRLWDEIAMLAKQENISYEQAQQRVLSQSKYALARVEGIVRFGDVILLLDKDSIVPDGASNKIVPEFWVDVSLPFVQSHTVPTNENDNYFARLVGYMTRIFYDVAFVNTVLSGGLVPFVGHNAYIRTEDLRRHGWWREDRTSEDLSFEFDLASEGLYGKYVKFEGIEFGEAVSNTFEEEARKYVRYGYGAIELFINPVRQWASKGILTAQMKRLLSSKSLPWYVKLDVVIYLISYLNLALSVPLLTFASVYPVKFSDVLGSWATFLFSGSLAVMVAYARESAKKEKKAFLSACAEYLTRHLKYALPFGAMFTAHSLYVLKGIALYLIGSRPHMPATSVDEWRCDSLREAWFEMKHTNRRQAVFAGLYALGLFVSSWFASIAIESRWLSHALFFSALSTPYVLNPSLTHAIVRKIDVGRGISKIVQYSWQYSRPQVLISAVAGKLRSNRDTPIATKGKKQDLPRLWTRREVLRVLAWLPVFGVALERDFASVITKHSLLRLASLTEAEAATTQQLWDAFKALISPKPNVVDLITTQYDGVSPLSVTTPTGSWLYLIYDQDGNPKDPATVVAFYEAIATFVSKVKASRRKTGINNILISAYKLNVLNGISRGDLNIFSSKTFGILYNSDGTLRDITKVISFYWVVAGFVSALKASRLRVKVNALIYRRTKHRIYVLNGISRTELRYFGGKDSGLLYYKSGKARNPYTTIRYYESLVLHGSGGTIGRLVEKLTSGENDNARSKSSEPLSPEEVQNDIVNSGYRDIVEADYPEITRALDLSKGFITSTRPDLLDAFLRLKYMVNAGHLRAGPFAKIFGTVLKDYFYFCVAYCLL